MLNNENDCFPRTSNTFLFSVIISKYGWGTIKYYSEYRSQSDFFCKQCSSDQLYNGCQWHLETKPSHFVTYKNPYNLLDRTSTLLLPSFNGLQPCLAFLVSLEHTKVVSAIRFCACWSLYLEALVFSFSLGWPHFCPPGYKLNFSRRTYLTNNLN